jgi:hypothetical protein
MFFHPFRHPLRLSKNRGHPASTRRIRKLQVGFP